MTSFPCCGFGTPPYQFQLAESVSLVVRALFGARETTAAEQLRAWRLETRKQTHLLVRAIREIDRRNAELSHDIKTANARRSVEDVAVHQFSLEQNDKARKRIEESKTHLVALDAELCRHARLARVSQTFSSSTEVMKVPQSMVSVGELRNMAREMSRSMHQMGLVDAAIADAFNDDVDNEPARVGNTVAKKKDVTEGILEDVIKTVAKEPVIGADNDAIELEEKEKEEDAELLMRHRTTPVAQMAK